MAATLVPDAPAVPGHALGVLVASDRDFVVRTVADGLRALGARPLHHGTAASAAAALGSPAVDAVVIDRGLPGVRWDLIQDALAEAEVAPAPLEEVERRHIAAMLRHTRGNRRNAAQLLGIARSTLLAKIRKYGLDGDPSLARR